MNDMVKTIFDCLIRSQRLLCPEIDSDLFAGFNGRTFQNWVVPASVIDTVAINKKSILTTFFLKEFPLISMFNDIF